MFSFILFCLVWNIIEGISPKIGFVYDSCKSNNALTFGQSNGGTLYWTSNQQNSSFTDHGLMNNSHIINCTVTLVITPQDQSTHKKFLSIFFRSWNYDSNYGSRYDANLSTTLFTPYSQQIFNACGSTCGGGCMQLEHPVTKVLKIFCGADQLTGTEHIEYFSSNFLILRFYLLGGYYISNGTHLLANFTRPSVGFIIDFARFYFGKCVDNTAEFQCIDTDRCIDRDLRCDAYFGHHCGLPTSGQSQPYDLRVCSTSTSSTNNLLPLLAILAAIPLVVIACIWLFYRPGICCWRLARIRNWRCGSKVCCGACYTSCCVYPCVLGNGPNICRCCKTTPNNESDYNNSNSKGSENDKNYLHTNDDNNVSAWTNYSKGDGYHLRECR